MNEPLSIISPSVSFDNGTLTFISDVRGKAMVDEDIKLKHVVWIFIFKVNCSAVIIIFL